MRLLIVTWLYEPHATPRAIRWKTVAGELVKMGCEVDVITSRAASEPKFDVLSGVNVYRCGGSAAAQLAGFAKSNPSKLSPAWLLRQLHRATWKRLYWPDKACLWSLPAIQTAERLLCVNHYDGMISVSLPFTSHLAGYRLKKSNPKLPWLADVGDPFSCQDASAPNNVHLHGKRNRVWESKVFERADSIAVTNEAMTGVYEELFPGITAKLKVIPPVLGWDVPRGDCGTARSAKKRLLFLGTMYRNIRNPNYLLAAFAELQKASAGAFELHLMGDLNDCAELVARFEAHLGSALIVHGNRPRAEAMRMLGEAEFVINIGNTTPFQLPSKLVEYAAMGKHIINFSNCEQDSSKLLLKGYPAALHVRQTPAPRISDLERLREFIEHPPAFQLSDIEPWLRQFSSREVAVSYLSALGLGSRLRRAA